MLHIHSLGSAYIAPRKGNIYLTVPQYNQMIFAYVYFFLVCILVKFLMKNAETRAWPAEHVARVDVIVFFVFWGIKSLLYTINYALYFRNFPIPKKDEAPANLAIGAGGKHNRQGTEV